MFGMNVNDTRLPSAEDLDAVAEEQRVAEETGDVQTSDGSLAIWEAIEQTNRSQLALIEQLTIQVAAIEERLDRYNERASHKI